MDDEERLGIGPLEPAERRLLASLRTGDPAIALGLEPEGHDDRGRVRAALIRKVMLGHAVPYKEIDPHGLQLTGAVIVGRLDLDDVSSPLALSFHDCILRHGVSAARASIRSIQCTGTTVIISDAHVVPFDATSATITHHLTLRCEVLAAGEAESAVSLTGAHIGGQLDCTGGTFSNHTGPALSADGLRTDFHAFLGGRFAGNGEAGAVRLTDAHIGSQLTAAAGEFNNPTGPALSADGLRIDNRANLGGRFKGSGAAGAVRLLGAHIGGQLDCTGGTFSNHTGPALVAERLRTDDNARLAAWFEGSGELGVVRLLGAHIGGQLDCTGGTFTNHNGPALLADSLRIDGSAFLGGTLEGSGELGVVRLNGAHIGGQLICTKTGALRSATAGALRLQSTTVQKELALSPDFVTGDTPARWLALDGLTYTGLPLVVSIDGTRKEPDLRVWRDLLSKHTTSYAAQPWQHLAAAHRAAGHEQSAKRLLIDQQDDRRHRVLRGDDNKRYPWLRVRRNVFMRGSKAFTGYGYKTSWTLWWLLGWAGVGVGVSLSTQLVDTQTTYIATGQTTATVQQLPSAVHGRLTPDPGGRCSTGELVGLGLEWALPIVKTGASTVCVVNTTDPAGQWMNAASWGVQAGGWALATLVVAGYTGIVRRL